MDIVIITPIYYILGRERLFHDSNAIHYLVKNWTKEHRVFVIDIYFESIKRISRYLDKKERQYKKRGYCYKIEDVSVVLIETIKIPKTFPTLSKKQSKKAYKIVNKWMRNNDINPDIIISHIPSTTYRLVEMLSKGIPKVAVMHATDMNYIINRKRKFVIESIYNSIFCRSKKIYEYFSKIGLNGLQDQIIYSGVPCCLDCVRKKNKPEKFHILYAGKLIKLKNVDIIIKALSQSDKKNQYILDIYGNGVEEKKLKKLVKKLNMDDIISFHSFVPRGYILEIMESADVFVMPSKPETLGLVYLEAMSRGCIPIGTKGQGIDGIICNGINGFLVDARDVENLKIVFETLFNMKENEFLAMQDNAIKTGQYYNEKDMGNKYWELVKKCIEY